MPVPVQSPPSGQLPTSAESADHYWMKLALEQARLALYISNPNPRVGCVIVKEGRLVASGFTQAAGQAHAEVMAIQQARQEGVNLVGSTFYVTLEPCSHHGRTPPCVDAIIKEAPARVVIALRDPNPQVQGRGLAQLRAAGIHVSSGIYAQESLALNIGFLSRMVRQRPWVWLKSAVSLDGGTALPDGQSQWITGAQSRADGHHWRARSCMVLTGVGTVLADNPSLTVRDVVTPRQPRRAIVDSRLRTPENARIFDGSEVWVFTCSQDEEKAARLQRQNAQVIALPGHQGQVHLPSLMQWLAQHEINEVHVEAGAVLGGALVAAGHVDELLIYMAPVLFGEAMKMVNLPSLGSLAQAHQFAFTDVRTVGGDVRLLARNPASWSELLTLAQPAKEH